MCNKRPIRANVFFVFLSVSIFFFNIIIIIITLYYYYKYI